MLSARPDGNVSRGGFRNSIDGQINKCHTKPALPWFRNSIDGQINKCHTKPALPWFRNSIDGQINKCHTKPALPWFRNSIDGQINKCHTKPALPWFRNSYQVSFYHVIGERTEESGQMRERHSVSLHSAQHDRFYLRLQLGIN
jgi:hypothetical protein